MVYGLWSVVCLAGCVSLPFKEPVYPELAGVAPAVLIDAWQKAQPAESDSVSAVIFQYKWHNFCALGYSRLVPSEQTFKLACLNPMGMKLFEFSGQGEEVLTSFVIPEFGRYIQFPETVGQDIRRIYFDLVPDAAAAWRRDKGRLLFSQPDGDAKLEYVFAGDPARLVSKSCQESGRLIWRARYYDYLALSAKLYPRGVVFENYKYGYRIIIKVKEIRETIDHRP
jgi:hypothetical protein